MECLRIGPYLIRRLTDGKLYISHADGEAGEFREADIVAAMDIFWRRFF